MFSTRGGGGSTYGRVGIPIRVVVLGASDELIRIGDYLALCILANDCSLRRNVNFGTQSVCWLNQVDGSAGICAEVEWIGRIIEPFRSVV